MKIYFDFQIFSIQNEGGISVYYEKLHEELAKVMDVEFNCLLTQNKRSPSGALFSSDITFPYIFSFKYYINLIFSWVSLRRKDFDVFHPTYYDPYFLSFIGDKPFVLTVFDMIHEKFPLQFNKNDPTSTRKRLLAIKAAKIIAISESTKKDLVELFDIKPSKIKVVPLAVNKVVNISPFDRSNLILYIGNRNGYKNFEFALKSIASVLIKHKYKLVCVGGGKFSVHENDLIQLLGLENHVVHKDADQNELAVFYSEASMLIYPSLYEGFGLPILEAFSFSCPVVCSNTSSMLEIGGNAAEYFNPRSKNEIKMKVEQVLKNKILRKRMIVNGKKILRKYSWEKTGIETYKVYEEVLNSYEKKATS